MSAAAQWFGPPQARGFGGVLPYRADRTVGAAALGIYPSPHSQLFDHLVGAGEE
jgi:hypothetical protein